LTTLRNMTTVRAAGEEDAEACVAIVRGLPEYFSPDVPDKVRTDLRRHAGWVVVRAGQVLGFAVVERRGTPAAEFLWAAVDPSARGQGIGGQLVTDVLRDLRADGIRLVEVKTLDATANYEPYEATRAFWERVGFLQLDTIDPLPGWTPGNPAAIYVAALDPIARRPSELWKRIR
jgi:ribosomal protein S18 acetylase RimI-like enzyme